MGDDRPAVYEEDGRWVYRASALGGCTKALAALRMGNSPVAPPAGLQKAFDEGNAAEDKIIELYEKYTARTVRARQQALEIRVSDTCVIRGHIDGLADTTLVEAKAFAESTLDDWNRKGWDGFPHYKIQTGLYWAGVGAESLDMVIGLKNYQGVVETIEIFHYDTPPTSSQDAINKVLEIERIAASGELPKECDEKWWGCPVWYLHEKPEIEEVEDEELKIHIRMYAGAKRSLDSAQKGKDLAQQFIFKRLNELGLAGKKLKSDKWEVTDVVMAGKKSLDTAKLKKDVKNLDDYYKTGKSSRYITLREVKDDSE